jgi:transposase-like protein
VKEAEVADDERSRGGGDVLAENRRLRAENRQLRLEREILKKATAFFAKHSK